MPTTITGSKKRQSEHISEDMVNNNKHAGFSPCSRSASSTTCSGSPGLDWDLAKAPDQTQADYLPTPFRPSDRLQYTGEYYDQPSLEDDRDLGEFTHWVLARIKNMLSTKWNISPKTRYKDQVRCFQEIKLGNAPVTNHEAA
ncbi:hypothetical protein F4818DRAFT_406342 [Hypoxylon cercidicola]|nr:hypothetical protein F4818DRAFT_406342 [Hypoxylon cercidicola]